MLITGNERLSQLMGASKQQRSSSSQLEQAKAIIEAQLTVIRARWSPCVTRRA